MQSLVVTNDQAMRLSFKDALANKVQHSLTAPPPTPAKDSTKKVLLLPSDFATLNEVDLHFSLMHNKELKHSRESANLAVEIVNGRMLAPKNISFETIELKNPVEIPQFSKKVEPKRGATRQLTPPDASIAIMQNEEVKRSEYQHYLANMFQRTEPTVEKATTLRVPANWNELSEQELFFTLTHQTELEHSRTSAYLAMDILSGKVTQPERVTLQEVVLFRPVAQPKPKFQVQIQAPKVKAESKTVAEFASKEEQFLLLPSHYEELSQAGLFYTLTHTPELKHSHDTANLAIAYLKEVANKPEWVKFQTVDIASPVTLTKDIPVVKVDPDPLEGFIPQREVDKRNQHKEFLAEKARVAYNTKPEFKVQAERIVLLPENYQAMNPGELHFALIRNPEFKHTNQQAIVTADMLSGRIGTPENVVFKTIPVDGIHLAPTVKINGPVKETGIKAAKIEATLLTRAQLPTGEGERTLLLPENFESMTETQLHFALSHNREYKHSYETTYEAMDIVFGRKACPKGTVFSTVEVTNPVERAY